MKNPWIWLVALIIAPILIFLRDGEFLGVTAATFTAENPMTVQSAEGPPAGIVLAQNNPSAGQPTAKQKKTPAPRSAPTSANRSNTTSQDQKLKAWGTVALGAFLLIFVLGMTNRVVVFQDGTDFTWSLMTLIAPVTAAMVASMLAPENAPEGYDIFWGDTYGRFCTVVGGLAWLLSVVKVFSYSIGGNGLVVGLIVGVFKIIASAICIFFAIGWINKLFDDQRKSYGGWALVMLVGGVFVWVLTKLINGDDVAARRQALGQAQGTP